MRQRPCSPGPPSRVRMLCVIARRVLLESQHSRLRPCIVVLPAIDAATMMHPASIQIHT
ncbi:hypothetical protein BCV04_009265 [Vibrio lentus]|nr:hypothetical protein [Vibrio lentus]